MTAFDDLLYRAGAWSAWALEREGGPCAKTTARIQRGGLPRRCTVRRLAVAMGVSERAVWRAIVQTRDDIAARRRGR